MPCLHRLCCYMAVWSTLRSSCCDRGQRVHRARLTSCCCNPADTPADGQANRQPTNRLGLFIDSSPMHPYSKLHGHIKPEGEPIYDMFITHYPQPFILLSIILQSLTKMLLQYTVYALKYWSLQVNHTLSPTFLKKVCMLECSSLTDNEHIVMLIS